MHCNSVAVRSFGFHLVVLIDPIVVFLKEVTASSNNPKIPMSQFSSLR
jgi:hypothetical protein